MTEMFQRKKKQAAIMSVNHTHVVTSVKNRRRREISTKVYEEIDTEIKKKIIPVGLHALGFLFPEIW